MTTAATISTHVLDTSLGRPAANIPVMLDWIDAHGVATRIARDVTNADGRVATLASSDRPLSAGSYRLSFDVAAYFAESGRKSFYSLIGIDFDVGSEAQHYHVPLLLSPFGYSTYRGS